VTGWLRRGAVAALTWLVAAAPCAAMQLVVAGDQLIASGTVRAGDDQAIEASLHDHPEVTTVILRNSPGGDAPAGYRVGALLREKGLHTAVSGFCFSSCSRMLLGGRTRGFTDDYPPEYTDIGLHGHYGRNGELLPGLVQALGLRAWIIRYSDGKADPALVDRWIAIPRANGMIHFYNPALLRRNGASTFLCQGDEASTQSIFGCEPIAQTALDLGIVTSLLPIASNDQAELRAALPQRPAPSGYAAIDDVGKLPLSGDAGIADYRWFLAAGLPRAFAISPDRRHWAWFYGSTGCIGAALSRCAQEARQACELYAVDEDVVWRP
jgi:hypothetical protein